ncbi:RtcB family protein [Candidatus Pacearchaeota archaeon]|nr:RtcB family protein [Candidatus Pacearchaeota archaeon]
MNSKNQKIDAPPPTKVGGFRQTLQHDKLKFIHEIYEKGMNVPAFVFASPELYEIMKKDKTIEQIKNVTKMPGVVEAVYVMPDAHQGYGFPIGGVAAFDMEKGVVSPGGVGYDINCGVRLLTTNILKEDFMKKRKEVMTSLAKNVPSGVGTKSSLSLKQKELDVVLTRGVEWAVENGFATKEDLENIESNGCISGADSSKVSQKAKGRGMNQLGSLGAGNHFLEVQFVEEILDKKIADVFGIKKSGQIVILIHSGSRGLGHQVASDYIRAMEEKYGFKNLPDRELVCAPIKSELGKNYLSAMACAANFGFVNRQILAYRVREVFAKFFPNAKLKLVYDVAHNIAKIETHLIRGKKRKLCVHRKGATRSFGPGNKEIPKKYLKTGQPIFIPGSMGTYSYVLAGTKKAESLTFGSTAHGAGRLLSRSNAVKTISPEHLKKELDREDVILETGSLAGAVEEAPEAYKDVNDVVRVSDNLGIGKLVARLKPLGVVKG